MLRKDELEETVGVTTCPFVVAVFLSLLHSQSDEKKKTQYMSQRSQ